MEYRDYYQILEVPRDASKKDIQPAYRRLARQYHPDRNPGDKGAEESFKQINEAHEVLSDPDKRRKYDALGADWQRWQRMGGDPRGFDFSQWFAGGAPERARSRSQADGLDDLFGQQRGFSDFFQTIFAGAGGGPRERSPKAQPRTLGGRDYEQSLEITLEEAYRGANRVVQVGGSRLDVRIPPGVKTGSRVRIRGRGAPGVRGAPAGDLYLNVTVLPHGLFTRKGDDLYCDVQVELYVALLGGEVRVPALSEAVQLKIPPETQGGRSFRLRGLGMPLLRDAKRRGDLYAQVRVVLPDNLTEQEKGLFRELASLRG
jgi:curved DNA-binding protein